MEFEGRKKISLKLDITPLIDVVFILLIFFLLTTSYLTEDAIRMALPESKTAGVVKKTDITLIIRENDIIEWNQRTLPLKSLKEELASLQITRQSNIYLFSSQDLPVRDLVRVLDEIRLAGFVNISIAVRKTSE